jgi:peptidoglycan/xylan/chitin deacetylase (PgdA/CDA1 family)
VQALVVIGVVVAAIAGGLYITWRARFGQPPPSPPPVLCFHKISRRFLWEGTWTTPDRFFRVIDSLRDRGYRFIGEDEFLATLEDESAADSGRLFLTFDDGYVELHDDILDGLLERNVPLHVFVVSDYAGKENHWDLSLGRPASRHASWEQLRDMVTAGVTVGSHTATHRDLTRLTPDEIATELTRSRMAIEDTLGVPARTLSYPFGRYDDRARDRARECGYRAAFSLYPRHRNATVDRWALRRNGVYIIDTPRTVAAKLGPNPGFWFEEMKGRGINAVAVLTPMLTGRRRRPRG